MWRKRLSEKPKGNYALVACAYGEVVGDLGLETYPSQGCREGRPSQR